ncbi:MAG: C40 family peptidase [Actinomyces sp.]|uniref:C40 family peptidase n=1 Tax=Schaalia sp. JY-X159 TaxID=2758575 RepID=UPI00165DBD70|nr:C40 family peptidase [Schaalia sp. JY-X159]MBP7880840.1 C40 family peptidase [Actinomyces sp.]
MTVNYSAPRHRSVSKTTTPLSSLTDTLTSSGFTTKRIAVASATGVAVTATIAGSAFAGTLPSAVPSQPSDDFVSNLSAVDSATLVSLDIAWEPGDEVAATAAEPAVEEVVEEVATETASRDYDRSAASAESSSVVPPARAGSVVETALQYVGYPYVYGGSSPSGFDCSGFVQYVFAQHGIGLPRTSGEQGRAGTQIPASEAQPGDLVVWGESHIAIYIGDGMIVHASTPATGVKVSSLYGSYYFSRV